MHRVPKEDLQFHKLTTTNDLDVLNVNIFYDAALRYPLHTVGPVCELYEFVFKRSDYPFF